MASSFSNTGTREVYTPFNEERSNIYVHIFDYWRHCTIDCSYRERAVRFPEVYEAWYTDWRFWAGIIGGSLINALLWPFTIIYEIYLVANGL